MEIIRWKFLSKNRQNSGFKMEKDFHGFVFSFCHNVRPHFSSGLESLFGLFFLRRLRSLSSVLVLSFRGTLINYSVESGVAVVDIWALFAKMERFASTSPENPRNPLPSAERLCPKKAPDWLGFWVTNTWLSPDLASNPNVKSWYSRLARSLTPLRNYTRKSWMWAPPFWFHITTKTPVHSSWPARWVID